MKNSYIYSSCRGCTVNAYIYIYIWISVCIFFFIEVNLNTCLHRARRWRLYTYNIICIKSGARGMRENKQPNGLKLSQRDFCEDRNSLWRIALFKQIKPFVASLIFAHLLLFTGSLILPTILYSRIIWECKYLLYIYVTKD